MRHTPGPWGIYNGNNIVKRIHHGDVGLICSFENSLFRDEQEANMSLVAAAPDMLECLRMAIARVEILNREGNPVLSAWLNDAKEIVGRFSGT